MYRTVKVFLFGKFSEEREGKRGAGKSFGGVLKPQEAGKKKELSEGETSLRFPRGAIGEGEGIGEDKRGRCGNREELRSGGKLGRG